MFKGNRKYIFILSLCFIVLVVVQYNTPKPIDWRQTYSKKDRIPYGTYALFEFMNDIFPTQQIIAVNRPIYNTIQTFQNGNYVFINSSFAPDKLDTKALLSFVSKGNNAFIAANYFYGTFADTLKIKSDVYYDYYNLHLTDSGAVNTITNYKDTVMVNFSSPYLKSKRDFLYTHGVEDFAFTNFDTSKTTVLGTNKRNVPNYIRISYGKGNLYLNALPEVFSNYHFVSEPNNEYVYKALAYLPVKKVIWDEYYKTYGHVESQTPMRVILNNPALCTAWFLLLTSLIVFILFGIKRRQRIIPVIEPLRNTTLEFVEIVGTLYYQKGDHKNITSKKINYFLEYIRSSFFVKTNLFDNAFIHRIVSLSGIAEKQVRELFNFIVIIQNSSIIREEEVLKLNSLIEKFQLQSKR